MQTKTTAITTYVDRNNQVVYSILILGVYLLAQFGNSIIAPVLQPLTEGLPGYLRSVIWSGFKYGFLPLLSTLLIFGRRYYWSRLGLSAGFWRGLGAALLMSLPMFIGYAWLTDFTVNMEWGRDFWFGTIAAPLFEEVFFRAFLFGLLYRYGGWGLLPATLLDGFVFGIIHVGDGDPLGVALGVFAVTAAGAVGFSVIYKEWGWNLWLVIFLHAFMNLSWMMFDVATNAAGGAWANVFRIMTVVLALGMTVLEKRRLQKEGAAAGAEPGGEAHSVAMTQHVGRTPIG